MLRHGHGWLIWECGVIREQTFWTCSKEIGIGVRKARKATRSQAVVAEQAHRDWAGQGRGGEGKEGQSSDAFHA